MRLQIFKIVLVLSISFGMFNGCGSKPSNNPYSKENILNRNHKVINGKSVASFVLTDTDSNKIHIGETKDGLIFEEYPNKIIILVFSTIKDNCPPCKQQLKYFKDLTKKYKYNYQIIFIDSKRHITMDNLREFKRKNHITYPLIPSRENQDFLVYIANKTQWKGTMPFFVTFNTNNAVEKVYTGYLSLRKLEKEIKYILDQNGCKHYNPKPLENETLTWTGGCDKDGWAEGTGLLNWYVGGQYHSKYEGSIKKGKEDGKGTYYFNNGEKYIGQYHNGIKEGKGIFYYANGDVYNGYWDNNKKHGKGTLTLANGVTYKGRWIRGDKEYKMKKTIPAIVAYNNLKNTSSHDYVEFIKKYPSSDIVKNTIMKDTKIIDKIIKDYGHWDGSNAYKSHRILKSLIDALPHSDYFVHNATERLVFLEYIMAKRVQDYQKILKEHPTTKHKTDILKKIREEKKYAKASKKNSNSKKRNTNSGEVRGLFGMLANNMAELCKNGGCDNQSSTSSTSNSSSRKNNSTSKKRTKTKATGYRIIDEFDYAPRQTVIAVIKCNSNDRKAKIKYYPNNGSNYAIDSLFGDSVDDVASKFCSKF